MAEHLLTSARQAGDRRAEASALTDLGATLFQEGDPYQATGALEAALAIDPSAWAVHYNLAAAYLALGHRDQALAALTEAVRLHPATARAARRNSAFQPLYDDPEFERILARAA